MWCDCPGALLHLSPHCCRRRRRRRCLSVAALLQGRHITEFADTEKADLLVLGSRGMGSLKSTLYSMVRGGRGGRGVGAAAGAAAASTAAGGWRCVCRWPTLPTEGASNRALKHTATLPPGAQAHNTHAEKPDFFSPARILTCCSRSARRAPHSARLARSRSRFSARDTSFAIAPGAGAGAPAPVVVPPCMPPRRSPSAGMARGSQ